MQSKKLVCPFGQVQYLVSHKVKTENFTTILQDSYFVWTGKQEIGLSFWVSPSLIFLQGYKLRILQ